MTASPERAKELNKTQFGANANNYVGSVVHAKGASLGRMVELVDPRPDWVALDVATAAGHTAFAFAPHVATMTATDLTPEMVALCAERAIELGHSNVETQLADAEALPFDDASFDLVTCRIAPHHFPHPARFVSEVARVLAAGGIFALLDNVVPDDPAVATFCDDWERRRDPSHVRCLSILEWSALITAAGLLERHIETAPKRMGFQMWVDNMNVPIADRPGLLSDLFAASSDVRAFLRPEGTAQGDAVFHLTEGLIVASKPRG